MFPTNLAPRQQAFLDDAREWYQTLCAGVGTPLNQVPHIRKQLANAGVEADRLDLTRKRTAAEVEQELDQAYSGAERLLETAWRDLKHRFRTDTEDSGGGEIT